jgi:hypothetical protein
MALRIQRVWRGFLGRRRAAHRYLDFVRQKREIIRGLCRCWKARRTLRIKRAEFLNRTATTLQCAYRSRASRKYFMELKRKALERMATRLQKAIRGFVCRRWVFRLRSLADVTLTDMKRVPSFPPLLPPASSLAIDHPRRYCRCEHHYPPHDSSVLHSFRPSTNAREPPQIQRHLPEQTSLQQHLS